MVASRADHSCSMIHKMVVVVGGLGDPDAVYVEKYTEDKGWKQIPPMRLNIESHQLVNNGIQRTVGVIGRALVAQDGVSLTRQTFT